MRKIIILSFCVILFSFLIGLLLYPSYPDVVASHWNANNVVDSHMSKFWGLFLIPLMSAFLMIIFLFLPIIDPLRKNLRKFIDYYYLLLFIVLLFLFYVHLLTILWNLNYHFLMIQALIPALAILIFFLSIILIKCRRNWFVGIRTPWTLSSDQVWDKTHALGSKIFRISSLIILLGVFFPDYAVWFILIPILVSTLYTVVYSYFVYRKIKIKKLSVIANKK